MDNTRFEWKLSERQADVVLACLYAEWLRLHPVPTDAPLNVALFHGRRWSGIRLGVDALLRRPFTQDNMTLLLDELSRYGESALANELCSLLVLAVTRRLGLAPTDVPPIEVRPADPPR